MALSDVFKFTQGLGQRGHQIGRKVGDALELLTLGMIWKDDGLKKHLVLENGVEGATTAEHKVEFAFYNPGQNGKPVPTPENLFGMIECKKVGVEQTTKQSFKTWRGKNKGDFHLTAGYSFSYSGWKITVAGEKTGDNNIRIKVVEDGKSLDYRFQCEAHSQVLIVQPLDGGLCVLGPGALLSSLEGGVKNCMIVETVELDAGKNIKKINVDEALAGPQTPEKAKQASFVSLDVRKRVLGHFDKTEDKSFFSVLVIAEAVHWEPKSRSMVRLCNDANLVVSCEVIVYFFNLCLERFGDKYQALMTKKEYIKNPLLRAAVDDTLAHFGNRVLQDMDTEEYVRVQYRQTGEGKNRLVVSVMPE